MALSQFLVPWPVILLVVGVKRFGRFFHFSCYSQGISEQLFGTYHQKLTRCQLIDPVGREGF